MTQGYDLVVHAYLHFRIDILSGCTYKHFFYVGFLPLHYLAEVAYSHLLRAAIGRNRVNFTKGICFQMPTYAG